jgi:riboflavin synthase
LFSGIVEEIGTILSLTDSNDGRAFKIGASLVTEDVSLGHSISVAGCCLTVVEFGSDWFSVELVHETLRKTTLGKLKEGGKVNLERSLKLSDRLGGHLVSGHIEAVAKIASIEEEGFSRVITFALPAEFSPYFVEKGSVAIEGCSLTVWGVEASTARATAQSSSGKTGVATGSEAKSSELKNGAAEKFQFKVALIPHTLAVTTLGALKVGDEVNIETDIVARYVARWLEPSLIGHNLIQPGFSALAVQ